MASLIGIAGSATGAGTTTAVVVALITALAALAVGLLNYLNQSRVLKEQREQLERQLAIAREVQVTERFTRAIEHLGNETADVRIGGIYALEQIANTSEQNRRAILEVLTAFVQGHAPWPPGLSGQPGATTDPGELTPLRAWAPDVQAAMTVLGRRTLTANSHARLNLERVDLRFADLRGANLQNAILRRGGFHRAMLPGANLEGADLARAQLQSADLRDAQLQECMLRNADLRSADLGGANLEGANLEGADLREAILGGTNLRGTRLDGAKLQRARDTSATTWPEQFDPSAHDVIRQG